jgi:dipeptidyl-peptidase 4
MKRWQFALAIWALSGIAFAQGSRADYERSANLRRLAQGKVVKTRVDPHWFDDNKRFWYRNDLGGGAAEFVLVDAVAGKREAAFDHAALAKALAAAAAHNVEPTKLPFSEIEIDGKGDIHFVAFQKKWIFNKQAGELSDEKKKPEPQPTEPITTQQPTRRFRGGDSPDRQWTAIIKDHNLALRSAKGDETVLTTDGTAEDEYTPAFFWSPDSTRLVAMKTRHGDERKIYMVDSSPRDQLQPKLITMAYDKPGDRLQVARPHLFDIEGKKEIRIADTLFPTPWTIDRVRWRADSSEFSFIYNQRGHQVLRLVGVDGKTGVARPIIDEQSKTFKIGRAHV